MPVFPVPGKTTLVERLIPALRLKGLRVSVVKHAHHRFDIDHEGKDTYRHREAGPSKWWWPQTSAGLMREFEVAKRPTVHHLLAELYEGVDWVLVEGFKDSDLQKMEVWRAASGKPARYLKTTSSPPLRPIRRISCPRRHSCRCSTSMNPMPWWPGWSRKDRALTTILRITHDRERVLPPCP